MERVEQFFMADDIDNHHKVPTLFECDRRELRSDLCAAEGSSRAGKQTATKSFQEIVTTLQEHLSPKPLEIAERFCFYQRNQLEGESILSYVAELTHFATHCNFGANLIKRSTSVWTKKGDCSPRRKLN